jgi:hypothetical protein
MSLEALVGGKIFILIWFPRLSFRSHIQQTVLFFRCFWQVQQLEAASHGNPRSFYIAVTVALE